MVSTVNTTSCDLHLETETPDDFWVGLKAALVCFGLSVTIVIAGFLWLGRAGMLEVKSPDFFPLPDFCAVASFLIGVFFLANSILHWIRFNRFGPTYLDCNNAELGKALQGKLRISKTQYLGRSIDLTLRCEWRHYQDGAMPKDTREVSTLLWNTTQKLDSSGAAAGIPFRFDVPTDGLATGRRPNAARGVNIQGPGRIEWFLRATAKHLYAAEFEIPIGAVSASARLARTTQEAPLAAQLAAAALGGYAPSQDEIDDEEVSNKRREPVIPFGNAPVPVTSDQVSSRRITLAIMIFAGFFLARELISQVMFGGTDQSATIVDATRGEVTLNFGLDDPAHKISVSSFHSWQKGQPVTASCRPAEDGKRRCRMQTGHDRWLNAIIPAMVFLVALVLRRHTARKLTISDLLRGKG